MTFYIDGDCPFCRWGANLFRRLLALPNAQIVHSQSDPRMHELMRQHNSWILKTDHGDYHFGFDAITYATAHSGRRWLRWLSPLLRFKRVQRIGQAIYELITFSRPLLSRFVPATA
jgi:hypothetical protein